MDPGADLNILEVSKGPRPPLFLVAAPGVNALGYVGIARLLDGVPVYVVQSRQRGRRFPPEGIGPGYRDEFPIVAEEYVASLRAVQPHGPYQLAGSCDGALLAFEMARMLERAGERVSMLAMMDTWPLEHTSIYPLVLLKIRARAWVRRTPAQRRALLEKQATKVARFVGVASTDDAEKRRIHRRGVWRAKLWPGREVELGVVDAPITVLKVRKQPYWRIRDDALGWRARTRGEVTIHTLPGTHATWLSPPHLVHAARVLGAYVAGAPSAEAPTRFARRPRAAPAPQAAPGSTKTAEDTPKPPQGLRAWLQARLHALLLALADEEAR